MKKRKFAKILALVLAFAFILTACGNSGGGKQGGEKSDNPGKKVERKTADDELAVCLASEPQTLDPALNSAVDGATMLCHLFSGLAKWDKDESGKLVIVPDCAKELPEPVKNADGSITYTYTLKDGLKWSDGKELTANDFIYSWQRAAAPKTAADYGYLYAVVKGYDEMYAKDKDGKVKNPDAKLAIEAPDAKTIKVTLPVAVPYWNELLAFPTFFPVREDVVKSGEWATKPETYISNGAYKMVKWDHNSVIGLEKNANYIDADKVTMPKVSFYLSDDAPNQLSNFKNGDWQLIDDVPSQEIDALKKEYGSQFHVTPQIGTYYISWNVNKSLLPKDSKLTGVEAEAANEEIRNALSLLIDRNHIVKEIGKAEQIPAPAFVPSAMLETDKTTPFINNAGPKEFPGYFDVSAEAFEKNYNQAIETLKKYYTFDEGSKKFTNVPTMVYLYNTSEGHKAIGEYIQSCFANVGIPMNMENQEWATFLETRKSGNFSVARNGWNADYNDPISFLDMWITASGNNDIQYGKGAHKDLKHYSIDCSDLGVDLKVENGTWAETYDKLISIIKATGDNDLRYKLMHKAEDMLMSTGCITPIYFYTDIYMLDGSVQGYYDNPLGMKYFSKTSYAK